MKRLVDLLFEARKTSEEALGEGLGLVQIKGKNTIVLVDWNSSILNVRDLSALSGVDADEISSRLIDVVGMIDFSKVGEHFQVARSGAQKKYGPLMYYILAKLSPSGFIMSDRSVSVEARSVWSKFYNSKVERKVRPEVERRDGGVSPSLARDFFDVPAGKQVYLPLCYAYAPKDSRIMLRSLMKENQIGMQDFAEQVVELFPSFAKDADTVIEHHLTGLIYRAASRFFSDQYDKSKAVRSDADNPTSDFLSEEEPEPYDDLDELEREFQPESLEDRTTDYTGEVVFHTPAGKKMVAHYEHGAPFKATLGNIEATFGGDGGGLESLVVQEPYGTRKVAYDENGDGKMTQEGSILLYAYVMFDGNNAGNSTLRASYSFDKPQYRLEDRKAGRKWVVGELPGGIPDWPAEAQEFLASIRAPKFTKSTLTKVPDFP